MCKGYVYLTIELSNREFVSKTLIAARLLAAGYNVIIGQQWAIFKAIEQLPLGSILLKGYHKIYWPFVKKAKELGFGVFAHDEELFIQYNKETLSEIIEGIDQKFFDAIFTTGQNEEVILNSNQFMKTISAGNPRIELLGGVGRKYFNESVADIKKKYGEYLLINTNFGTINSVWQSSEQVRSAAIQAGVRINIDEYLDACRNRETFAWNFIQAFISRNNKKFKIIIRPHPSERLDKWQLAYAGYENIHIIREGNHIPWTLAASALIHSGCLTGIEAAIIGTPSYNICQLKDDVFFSEWHVDKISKNVYSVEALESALFNEQPSNRIKLDAISKITFGVTDNRVPSEIMADYLCRSASKRSPPISDIMPIVDFGENVPQLEYKCSIKDQDLIHALMSAGNALNITFEAKYTCLAKSLYLLQPECSQTVDHNHSVILKQSKFNIDEANDDVNNEQMYMQTFSSKHALTYAGEQWATGKRARAVEALYDCFICGNRTPNLLDTLGRYLITLGKGDIAKQIYCIGREQYPDNLALTLGFVKTAYKENPTLAETQIWNILYRVKCDIGTRAKVFTDLIEYLGFCRRISCGYPPYHVTKYEDIGFSQIHGYAKDFFEVTKVLWQNIETRNAETYQHVALSHFAYGGIHRLKQFLPLLSNSFRQSVWASVTHWETDARMYEAITPTIHSSETLTFIYSKTEKKFEEQQNILVSCDTKYYVKFGRALINSLERFDHSSAVVLHLMSTNPEQGRELADQAISKQPKMTVILEDVSRIDPNEHRVYFHIARFFRLVELLIQHRKPVWLMDVDSLCRNDPSALFKSLIGNDVAFRGRATRIHPWNQINASLVGFAPTTAGIDYASRISGYLSNLWSSRSARWGADQVAMFMIMEYLKNKQAMPRIRFLSECEVDYDHSSNGIFWQNSGIGKFLEKDIEPLFFKKDGRKSEYLKYFDLCSN